MIKKLAVLLVIIPSLAFAVAPDAPTNVASDLNPNWVLDESFPFRVYDENYGDWQTEIAFGSFVAFMDWYDAPGEEAGNSRLQLCGDGPVNSGKYYCAVGSGVDWPQLIEYNYATQTTRLVLDKLGKAEGDSIEVRSGYPFYNSYDDTVYLFGNGFCIRKLVDDLDGTHSVSVFSGDCDVEGDVDGNSSTSRYGKVLGATADGAGNLWLAESYLGAQYIRKVDVNGAATKITDWTRNDGGVIALDVLNAPYIQETMSPGRDSTHVHIADSWTGSGTGWSAQRISTSTHAMTRVAGVVFSPSTGDDTLDRSALQERDGPALTHAYANQSQRGAYYSKFYDSIIFIGQDNYSIGRYSYATDWVKVISAHYRPWASYPGYTDEELYDAPFPTEFDPIHTTNTIPIIKGTDRYGGLWITTAGTAKLGYRIFNPTLGGLALGDIP